MPLTNHQLQQQSVINKIADQVGSNSLKFSTVAPTADYEDDPRICLTSVHFPRQELINQVQEIINPLQKIEPDFFYYPGDSLHLTIKNVRIINDPPNFNQQDVKEVEKVFSKAIPHHQQFKIYFYRLLMFPNNLALVGTTDPELDNIILDLDEKLREAGVPDDKVYANSRYFFSNMTLARFNSQPSREFKEKVLELSNSLKMEPYLVDSVTLVTANAVFKKINKIKTWELLQP